MALPQLNVPKYELKIPSTGVKASYRPYLVKEEKILMIAIESEDSAQMSNALKEVIDECTFKKLKINDLTLFDIEYIFAKLRAKSVGETSEVKLPCEKCEQPNEVMIDLEGVDVTAMPAKKIELTSDTGLVMKFPSMADYLDIQNSNLDNVGRIFAIIVASIDSIYSGDEMFDAKSHTHAELNDFVESLNADQFKKVQAFLNEMPAAFVNANFKCEGCGHDNHIELKGMMNFFA
jgi:hypothetical protein